MLYLFPRNRSLHGQTHTNETKEYDVIRPEIFSLPKSPQSFSPSSSSGTLPIFQTMARRRDVESRVNRSARPRRPRNQVLYIPNAIIASLISHSAIELASPCRSLVVCLLAVVVLLLHEEVLVCAVAGEEDGRRAEARKAGAEAVPAAESALGSPSVTVNNPSLASESVKSNHSIPEVRRHAIARSPFVGRRGKLTLAPKGRSGPCCQRPP